MTLEQIPSYQTITRFRVSNEIETLINQGLDSLVVYLREKQLIDDALFIDGTKVLADANKYSFVWKKSTIKFDQMNQETILRLINELSEAYQTKRIPEGTAVTLERIDEILTRMTLHLEMLGQEVNETKKVSPNPSKQKRRTLCLC